MKTVNTFQKHMLLPSSRQVLWEVIKLFHPTIEQTSTNPGNGKTVPMMQKMKIEARYDWITIKGQGVSIGLQYDGPRLIMGPCIPIAIFQDAHDNGFFKAWRFVDDKLCVQGGFVDGKYVSPDYPSINELMTEYKVPKPTAKEMFDYYIVWRR